MWKENNNRLIKRENERFFFFNKFSFSENKWEEINVFFRPISFDENLCEQLYEVLRVAKSKAMSIDADEQIGDEIFPEA